MRLLFFFSTVSTLVLFSTFGFAMIAPGHDTTVSEADSSPRTAEATPENVLQIVKMDNAGDLAGTIRLVGIGNLLTIAGGEIGRETLEKIANEHPNMITQAKVLRLHAHAGNLDRPLLLNDAPRGVRDFFPHVESVAFDTNFTNFRATDWDPIFELPHLRTLKISNFHNAPTVRPGERLAQEAQNNTFVEKLRQRITERGSPDNITLPTHFTSREVEEGLGRALDLAQSPSHPK